MKRNHLLLSLLLNLFSFSIFAQNQKPNIVLVITDDQGKNDLACEGNPYIKTPNLDQFHANAIRFTNFHVSTTCAPSRGAIMTGRHTNRLNVFHTIAGRSLLFEDEVLISQVLAQNGYTNGMFGKWHLGDNYPFRPMDRGFHEVVRHGGGGVGQSPDYWGNDYFDDTYWHNGKMEKYEGYCTDVFFNEALKFIEKEKDNPFFCYISTNAPHTPLNCPETYLDLYKDIDLPEYHQRFYGMITNIDDNFKRLMDKLNDLQIAENTIIIFMTDNGTAGGQKIFDAGMSGGKGSVLEGGHRVPFYLQWTAGEMIGGKNIDKLTAHYDILPTLVELTGSQFTPIKKLDGKSLVPLLKNKDSDWKDRILYMDTQRELNLIKYKDYAVMDEYWRLVNDTALYDLRTDSKQKKNIIAQHPEVANRLAEGYEKWWQSFEDEGVNERYAYIKAGTAYENPVRIAVHDLISSNMGWAWHQKGIAQANSATGRWKIEIAQDGIYKVSLHRFPKESNLAINATFPEVTAARRLDMRLPASIKSDFKEVYLHFGKHRKQEAIPPNATEVSFELEISAGKYDVEAQLLDAVERVFPAYYLYIELVD